MAPKRAVRNQQDTSQATAKMPAAKAAVGPMVPLASLAENFAAAAAQCVEDAKLEAVHQVRTGSRRLQATLQAMLREAPADVLDQVEQPVRAMLRPLKQIRRAAAPVRDLDVHRKLLEGWLGRQAPRQNDGDEVPAVMEDEVSGLHTQAETLDKWLKDERKHLAHAMQKQLRRPLQELVKRQSEVSKAIEQIRLNKQESPRTPDAVALEDFVRATEAMPLLDAENLHDFRKATKKARYVAEADEKGKSNSSVAKALKRIQDAIGEWHDWFCLAQEAKKALGQDAPQLTAALQHEVERHFATAMETTLNMRGRLVGEWIAMNQPQARRPPAAIAMNSVRAASGY